jgi:hypothetical protein
MIEINLVPDVKQELLKAQRVRTGVISVSILVCIVTVGIVVLLALWVFGVQTVRSLAVDGSIKDKSSKLAGIEDISNTLTIQNQLSKLDTMHDNKKINSRIFDVLQTINPPAPNDARVTNLKIDTKTSTITLQAQSAGGFGALDVFKKTINATTLKYTKGGSEKTVPLASSMSDTDRSYGEDTSGTKVLRFTLSFKYPAELFSREAENVSVVAPSKTNATDSFLGVPQSLFTQKASDLQEGN